MEEDERAGADGGQIDARRSRLSNVRKSEPVSGAVVIL